ncbi:hypothetical protein [Aneurinibacillus sp. UBA3580]|jgi:hypothetical protein|uniref:hypothetical protein n=1 Tax=Aneurinibacillus sp. UBA3580 TaxID=1946041 RepID=UPI00257DAEDC|nr:hypothetical protein [Aneurinibacillus sp. UBA3580]
MESLIAILLLAPLLFVPLLPMFLRYVQGTHAGDEAWKLALFLFLGSAFFFIMIDLFTVPLHVTSGNGNLALLVMAPAVVGIVLFATMVGIFVSRLLRRQGKALIRGFLLGDVLLLGLMIIGEVWFVRDSLAQFDGEAGILAAHLFRFGMLNQYTNTLYFNMFTFLIPILIAALIGGVSAMEEARDTKRVEKML